MKDEAPPGHPEDEAAGASADERLSARALFQAHAGFVASFLRRLGTHPNDVDDLTQEVFLIAHKKGGFTPGAGQPRTWLSAIALRVASTGRRTRRRRREQADDDALSASATPNDPIEQLEARSALARVQHALDSLDLEHRAAFVLYEIDGESCESIAHAYGVPVGTVYSRLHHARRRFQEAYDALARDNDSRPLRTRTVEGT